MPELTGIRFHQAGKVYYFDTAGIPLQLNDRVIVETARGQELGWVVIAPGQVVSSAINEPLKPVLRKATDDDVKQSEQRLKKNEKALAKSKELIEKLNLPMKPVAAQYNLDGSHLTVFFSAEKRVDFRELVKELSRNLRTHVELRQIGARDEAKHIGGLGRCGFPLCCTTFLSEFTPVSIKMAKEQNITLNPMKTSGLCGRLLCCLGYEYEQYRTMKENLPQAGHEVSTSLGKAKVITINPLKEAVLVELESGAIVEMSVSKLTWQKKIDNDNSTKMTKDNK
jgi:cell fate regulator YaaT (PSP1 superfamily)